MSDHIQTIVIGAGAVGLAIGRELARAGQECLILESTPKIGQGVSSRNSEVIHAGIYYPDKSLKTEFCVSGNKLLYDYAEVKGINHKRIGKYIIASSKDELEKLAIENAEIKGALAGMKVSKVVTVAPKLVNFVV